MKKTSLSYNNKKVLYLFHPLQFPTLKLHDNLMQLCSLTKCLHSRSLSIAMDLLDSHLPLQLSLRMPAIFAYGIEVILGQYFQFYDITVLRRIMCQVGQEEEIAIAMAQFEFGSRIIIACHTELRHTEPQQVALRLYASTH